MDRVTIRDLRNHGGEVVDRVLAGESLMLTRSGEPVAELRPVAKRGLSAEVLLKRWRGLPALDERRFRTDIDGELDSSL